MDDWIKLRQELKNHHLSPLEEKLLPEVISKLRMEGGRLNAETVAAEARAAVRRHLKAKNAEKLKRESKQRGKSRKKTRKAK